MFTASKLKTIMPLMHECGTDLVKYMSIYPEKHQNHIDCKVVMQRFTIEILGNLGCGIKPNVLNLEESVFFNEAMILSGQTDSVIAGLRFAFNFFFPEYSYKHDVEIFDKRNFNFFVDIIQNAINLRKTEGARRNDFIDILLDTIKEIEDEKKTKIEDDDPNFDLKDFVIANCVMLFFVGNDTSSGALALAMHFLARHPDVQEKLYNEIQVT